jgi:DNA (cytosine-5)-methyltransferase 1
MKHGSLFSGVGGWDLASEWMGWENVFHCELDEFPRSILNKYWPSAATYEDITKADFTIHRRGIDILTGSDPCQPHSFAGKRTGTSDERFLWPEMLRAVKEIQPAWVVNENVEGTISNGVLDTKISDLETEGYTCWPPLIMPANAFGSLHKRNRVWLVAYSERYQQPREEPRNREAGRMGRKLEPLAWHYDWEAQVNQFRGMDDGLPRIVHRTDAMRNAIVPQIAFHIFQAIENMAHESPQS